MRISKAFFASSVSVFALIATGYASENNLSQLVFGKGLQIPRYRWNAWLITPNEKYQKNAVQNNGSGWDFNKGGMEGITRYSRRMKNVKTSDGKLEFTVTGPSAYFYWGDHFNDEGVKGLDIGKDWPANQAYGQFWRVLIRVKQSLPESEWTVSAKRAGAPATLETRKVTVKGKDWQTVSFDMGRIAGNSLKAMGNRRNSLCVQTKGKGNHIEIDWIKLQTYSRKFVPVYIRKTIQLDKPVDSAKICLVPQRKYQLFINGVKVKEGLNLQRRCVTVDCGKYFKPGKNVIAYTEEAFPKASTAWSTAFEGIILYKDGNFKRFYTNGECEASFRFAKSWMDANFDASAHNWKKAKTVVRLAKSPLPGYYAIFIDPPYLGPIDIAYPGKYFPEDVPSLFKFGTPVKVAVKLHCRKDAKCLLKYEVTDAFTGKKLRSGDLKPDGGKYPFSLDFPKPGIYNLLFTAYSGGKILDTRFEEIGVIGKIQQTEVPPEKLATAVKRKLVAEICCGKNDAGFPYMEHVGVIGSRNVPKQKSNITGIITACGVKCRETGKAFTDWFAYEVQIKNIYKPHIVEVEYPDDRPQRFVVRAKEKRRFDSARSNVCVFAGEEFYPSTGKLQKAQFIYFPQNGRVSIDVENLFKDGSRASIHKISVYEVLDLPAPKIGNSSGRLIGTHIEHPWLLLNAFYAGPSGDQFAAPGLTYLHKHHGFLKKWYSLFENQIKFMKYCGDNTLLCSLWKYRGAEWPSKLFFGRARVMPQHDYLALGMMMFEENNMTMIPLVQFCNSLNLVKFNTVTDKEMTEEGKDTIMVVSKEGKQIPYGFCTNSLNPIHPKVRREIARVAEELSGRYAKYKAFGGVALFAGGLTEPGYYLPSRTTSYAECLKYGWDDTTVKLFEKSTKIHIPVNCKDPERFRKRYNWVMKNHRKEWIDFRCRELYKVNMEILAAIRKGRKNCKYYLFYALNNILALEKNVIMQDQSAKESFRMLGMDPQMYRGKKGIEVGWFYATEPYSRILRQSPPGLNRTFNIDPRVNELLDCGDNTSAFLLGGFFEPDIRNIYNKKWLWKGASQVNPNPWWGARYFTEPFTDRVSRMTPGYINYMWTDNNLYLANGNLRGKYNCAFQAIPKGEYRTLTGSGLDRNIIVREQVKSGKRYFYVVNPAWWKTRLKLVFSGKAAVSDLLNGKEATLSGNSLSLNLANYDVKVFSVPASIKLAGAESKVDPAAIKWFAPYRKLLDDFMKNGAELKMAVEKMGLREAPEKTLRRLEKLRKMMNDGNYSKARNLMQNPIIRRIIDFTREKQRLGEEKPRTKFSVNLGGKKAYRAADGKVWSPDQFYFNGLKAYGFTNPPGRVITRENMTFKKTKDQKIFRTERANFTKYCFKVPPGIYTLKIYFAEGFRYGPDRGFNVTVEGKKLLNSFDFTIASGGFATAYIKDIKNIKVNDGELTIEFSPAHMVRLQGIEVEKQD